MPRRARMTIHLRPLTRPPARSTGVIEMDVRDEHMADVLFIQAQPANPGAQCFQCRARSCFNEHQPTARLDHIGSDQPRRVLKMQIKGVNRHGSIDNGFVLNLHALIIKRRQQVGGDRWNLGI